MGAKDSEGYASERPRHEVTIPNAFAIGRFAVTFQEWDTARAADVVKPKPPGEGWGRGEHPVTYVSWDEAQTYVSWLYRVTGKPYRLLSEAEWEYACRAGTETAYSFGESITKTQAQYQDDWLDVTSSTVEVGSFTANAFGLYDMHGNVREWSEDRWHKSYAHKPESLKQTGGAWRTGRSRRRVLRGGSYFIDPRFLRSANRSINDAEYRGIDIGFRVARAILTS